MSDITYCSLTCPSKHRHGANFFFSYSEKPSHFRRLLRRTWGYGGSIYHFKPRVPTGVLHFKIKFWNHLFIYQNAYLKFFILCCMFKIDLYSKTLCCIQTCDVFYLYSITLKYFCDIRSEVCFYLHKRNKCMNFSDVPKWNAVSYIFGEGRGTSDRNAAGSNSIASESRTGVSRVKRKLYRLLRMSTYVLFHG